jgi:hypothetical protein
MHLRKELFFTEKINEIQLKEAVFFPLKKK